MTRDELVERMARAAYDVTVARYEVYWKATFGDDVDDDPYLPFEEMPPETQAEYKQQQSAALTELEKHAVVTPRAPTSPKIIWEVIGTGELKDGAVPFLPPTRAVWAAYEAGAWRKLSPAEVEAHEESIRLAARPR